MKFVAPTAFALAALLNTGTAFAQPGSTPVPTPIPTEPLPADAAPSPEAPAPVLEAAPPVSEVQPPVPATQPSMAAVQEEFDQANAALLANQFDRAISLFQSIADTTNNSDLRSAALAMRDFAEQLKASKAHITIGGVSRGGALASPDEESGRANLVITTTLAAFYSSFALVDILGVDDFTPISLSVAATTAAGLGLSLYATRDSAIHPATASAYSTGLIAGVANGLLLAPVLGIDVDGAPGDGDINQNYLLFGLTTMAAGGAAGYLLGTTYHPTEGQVTTTSMAGLTGFASTGLLLAMIQPDSLDGDSVAMLLATGMDIGLAGGALLTRKIDWSPSRANYVALSQFVGALGGFTAGALLVGEPSGGDEKLYAGLVLGGIWAGLAGGIHFTKDMKPDASMAAESATTLNLSPLLGEDVQGMALGGRF